MKEKGKRKKKKEKGKVYTEIYLNFEISLGLAKNTSFTLLINFNHELLLKAFKYACL